MYILPAVYLYIYKNGLNNDAGRTGLNAYFCSGAYIFRTLLSDVVPAVHIRQVSSQQEPEKGGAGPDYEHDDNVVFEADRVKPLPDVSGHGSHDEAQSDQESGQ